MSIIAYAQTQQNLSGLVTKVVGLIGEALFLLMAVAIIVFVWQVIHYFVMPNTDRKEAGQYVMYSVIGFFVIFSLWGLVAILSNTFGLQNSTHPQSWESLKNIFPQ